jgi:flagellar basal body-associated protein FliL
MLEESKETVAEASEAEKEDALPKPRLKLRKPNPIVYFIGGPFLVVFVIYVVLTKVLISSELAHEAKLKQVMASIKVENELLTQSSLEDGEGTDVSENSSQSEAGFLDIHNYFQFPMSFAVNVPDTSKNLTFDLAVSTFQSGVTAEWFFESFTAFVPAIRSDILYFMGAQSLEDLQTPDFQAFLLRELKDVINKKLESLGASPDVSKVLFVSYIVT